MVELSLFFELFVLPTPRSVQGPVWLVHQQGVHCLLAMRHQVRLVIVLWRVKGSILELIPFPSIMSFPSFPSIHPCGGQNLVPVTYFTAYCELL